MKKTPFWIILGIDTILIILSLVLSFSIRFEFIFQDIKNEIFNVFFNNIRYGLLLHKGQYLLAKRTRVKIVQF